MKNGYLIAYLGAAATMGIVLSKAGIMTKKYGQPIKEKKKLSVDKVAKTAEKGVNLLFDKVIK